MHRRVRLILPYLVAFPVLLFSAWPSASQSDDRTAQFATLDNGTIAVRFHLRRGTYDLLDRRSGTVALAGAHAEMERWSTRDAGRRSTAVVRPVRDEIGAGRALMIACARPGEPTLLLEFRLYPRKSFVVLREGIRNLTREMWRVQRYSPLADGDLYPGGGARTDLRTLNGPSGANRTEVRRDPYRSSPNNLLVTFRQGRGRRSLVLGGLKTAEFAKSAAWMPQGGIGGARRRGLERAFAGGRLAAYLDCGDPQAQAVSRGPRIQVEQGQPFAWTPESSVFSSVLFHEKQVTFRLVGLDPRKRYALGWSWWDYDANGRVQSVHVRGSDGTINAMAGPTSLPAWTGKHQSPTQMAAPLPPQAYQDGTLGAVFTNEARVPNAVVSEVWLWEIEPGRKVPVIWQRGQIAAGKGPLLPALAHLEASDPVGRRILPGALWMPDDSFYVDFATPNPFEALERYGRVLRLSTRAHPNPYDFPTVCAWYTGVWNMPGAQNHPEKSRYQIATTPGLVEEMEKARESGFLRYSRAAGRLVPDNYTENNPQGWWDDTHWQREDFYLPPYETSAKWGWAMQARGGLAFTYFQASATLPSRDFRETHPDWLLGNDPSRSLDFSKPATQAHMRRVFAAMRGAISGMMFDYCDELWLRDAGRGGFYDPDLTATAYYRGFMRQAKEGLGTDSWIHERSIYNPPADLALGLVDSQRTEGDTDRIHPELVARSGLRWYKNRVVVAYDMDSKELYHGWKVDGWNGTDTDGRRMLLTMAYVAASRLLLANSFRDMKPEVLHDLTRTFPYPLTPRSAMPVDAFVANGWPRVYDYAVSRDWHQVTLYNHALPGRAETITVPLSGNTAEGALGLSPHRSYYAFDFWNDRFAGRLRRMEPLKQKLRSGEARMLSLHAVEAHPQFLSTNRHLMQGFLDMAQYPRWNARRRELTGISRVVGRETYRVVLALNGWKPVRVSPGCRLEKRGDGLVSLCIDRPRSAVVRWTVAFTR